MPVVFVQTPAELAEEFLAPANRWGIVHVDLIQPHPTEEGEIRVRPVSFPMTLVVFEDPPAALPPAIGPAPVIDMRKDNGS